MDPARLLRAARRERRLSQRELAEYAQVPKSTVDRIEAGRVDPRLSTIEALAAAVCLEVVLVDLSGTVVDVDEEHDVLRDRAYRRLPAHLLTEAVRGEGDGWWGWRRIAWHPADPLVPERTYLLRARQGTPRHRRRLAGQWNDAT